jgi:diacylglycerol kinase (ATP)
MGKKVAIIANPFSGTSSKKDLFHQVQSWNQDHFDLLFLPTLHKNHGVSRVQEALDEGAEIVVAAGGDGTVNEVAGALYKYSRQTPLGILPAGSGNGFAMHLGLGRDLKSAFDFIKKGKTMLVDTCMVNDQFFLNVSGIGFDARIAYLTKQSSSRGFKRYFMTTMTEIRNFQAIPLEITLDDTKKIEGRFGAAIVANATMFGYNFSIAPTAELNDGQFDLILFKEAPALRYLATSYRMLTKTMHKSPLVQIEKAKKIVIKSPKQDYFHIDGEGFELNKELVYTIHPLSMSVIMGDGLVI